jgi:hypothetical protein
MKPQYDIVIVKEATSVPGGVDEYFVWLADGSPGSMAVGEKYSFVCLGRGETREEACVRASHELLAHIKTLTCVAVSGHLPDCAAVNDDDEARCRCHE